METWPAANGKQGHYEDGGEAAHWLAHEERGKRMRAPFTGHLLTAAAIRAATFAAIGHGLRPGGRLVFVCWQNLVGNQWIVVSGVAPAMSVLPDAPASAGCLGCGHGHA